MILAWHLVWTVYGWWFPNDLRGAWSKEVWKPALREIGDIDKCGRKVMQPSREELRNWISAAQKRLNYRAILLDARARQIAEAAITEHARLHNYRIAAMAVMPEHVHTVVMFHDHRYEKIVQAFKSVSSRQLHKFLCLAALPATRDKDRAAGSTAKQKPHPIWSRGYWVRYLDTEGAVSSAIAYVKKQDSSEV